MDRLRKHSPFHPRPQESDDRKTCWFYRLRCYSWLLDFLANVPSLTCFNKPKKNSEFMSFKNV